MPSCPAETSAPSSHASAAPPTGVPAPCRFASQQRERRRAASGCGSAMPRRATCPLAVPEMRNCPECETRSSVTGASCVGSSLIGCLKSKVHSYTTPVASSPSMHSRNVLGVTNRQLTGEPILGGSGSGSGSSSSSSSSPSFFSGFGGFSTTGTFISKGYTRDATASEMSKVVLVSTSSAAGAVNSTTSPARAPCPATHAKSRAPSGDHEMDTTGPGHCTKPMGSTALSTSPPSSPSPGASTSRWKKTVPSSEHDASRARPGANATARTAVVCGLKTCESFQPSRACSRMRRVQLVRRDERDVSTLYGREGGGGGGGLLEDAHDAVREAGHDRRAARVHPRGDPLQERRGLPEARAVALRTPFEVEEAHCPVRARGSEEGAARGGVAPEGRGASD